MTVHSRFQVCTIICSSIVHDKINKFENIIKRSVINLVSAVLINPRFASSLPFASYNSSVGCSGQPPWAPDIVTQVSPEVTSYRMWLQLVWKTTCLSRKGVRGNYVDCHHSVVHGSLCGIEVLLWACYPHHWTVFQLFPSLTKDSSVLLFF